MPHPSRAAGTESLIATPISVSISLCSPAESGAAMTLGLLQFEDRLLTGIESIDLQHKEFFLIYNDIIKLTSASPNGRVDLSAMVRDLSSHFSYHFAHEELVMRHIGYPFLREHKKAHRDIFNRFDEVTIALAHQGLACDDFLAFLRSAVCSHFDEIDRGIGLHYRAWLRTHPEGAPMAGFGV